MMRILGVLLLVGLCLPSCRQRESSVKNISGTEIVDIAPLTSIAIVPPNWGATNESVTNLFEPDSDSQDFLERTLLKAENLAKIEFSDFERSILDNKAQGLWHNYEHQLTAVMLQCIRTSINKSIADSLKTDSRLWQQLTQTFKLVDPNLSSHLLVVDRLDLSISDSVSEIGGSYAYLSVNFNRLSLSLIEKSLYQDFLESMLPQTKLDSKTVVKGVLAKGQTYYSKVASYIERNKIDSKVITKILFKNSKCSFDYPIEIPLILAIEDMRAKYATTK